MAQDTTPSIIMYQGGTNTFPVPFDKGYYGEVKVLFVRRGATGYEHEPASSNYVVSGRLYAWGAGSNYIYTHTPTPAVEAPVYNDQDVDSGKKVETTAGQTITVDGVSYIRATQHDISNHLILTWNGEELGVDDYICIGRDTERGQPYSLPNNQKHIEGALDNIERQVQELKDKTDNALVVDPTHTIDASKMGPIDWLETIVRSTDKTARAIRYHNGYLQFSLEDPEIPLNQKTWTSILNTINVTTIREWYDEEKKEYHFQYSKDNGASWKELPFTVSSIPGLENRLATIENEQVVLKTGVKGNADAILKTREDYISADSEIHKILNSHTSELTTLRGNQASLGDQVAGIEQKIPESASGSNPLVTKQQLLDEEMDIRDDLNEGLSELQTQITAQAAKIAGKQEKLVAGDNIVISGNVITATGAGGGAGFDVIVVQELPAEGQKGIIYLLAKDGTAPDVYDEYIWVTATQTFEFIGTTQVDLSGYATKEDLENIDALPDQSGNSGKFLTTDGTTASWSDKPLVNNGDESKHNLCVGKSSGASGDYNVCVGKSATSRGGDYNTVVGYRSQIRSTGTVIGANIQISDKNKQNVAIIGSGHKTMFTGEGIESDSFFWVLSGTPYKLCSSDGTIPAERMSATAGTTGQVLTKTDAGMEWQEPSGGTTITLKEYDE